VPPLPEDRQLFPAYSGQKALPVQRLRRWDEGARQYVVEPGAYELRAGPSSDKAVREAVLTVRQVPPG